MALFVIERNLAEQLQRSRDAARRVTEINRDIGVVMHKPVRRRECLRLAVATGLVALPAAAAEPYPSKPNRVVVPFGPGSGTDNATRIVAQHLGAALKQPVTTDNRPGASAAISASAVAQSAPDGYTLMMGTNSTHGANPGLITKLPYDPLRDFVPIGLVGIFSSFLVVNPTLPVRTPAELVTDGKANPKTLSFARGNVEYGAEQSGTRLVVVLGHTHCGAILGSRKRPRVGLPHPSRRTRASLPSASNRRCRPAGSGTRLRPGHPDSRKRSSERAPRGIGAWAKNPVQIESARMRPLSGSQSELNGRMTAQCRKPVPAMRLRMTANSRRRSTGSAEKQQLFESVISHHAQAAIRSASRACQGQLSQP